MDRNIDERLRKPRRTKGTPLYRIRNYWTVGVLAASGLCWYIYESWPQARKLKTNIHEGKLEPPEEVKEYLQRVQIGLSDEPTSVLLTKAAWKQEEKLKQQESQENGTEEQQEKKSKFWTETISKYFTQSPTVDSPFRNTLSDVEHNVPNSDDSDFKTPKPQNKRPFQPQKTKSIATRTRLRQKKINTLIKSVEENFSHEDHLQMALALSRSVCDEAEDGKNDEEVYKAAYCAQEKSAGLKRTLEEFGFKSGKTSRLPGVYQKGIDTNKKRKKSKFRYVTPILFIRTEEERKKIVANKISLVLGENLENKCEDNKAHCDSSVSSAYLEAFHREESVILKLNSLERDELNKERFYVKSLNFTPSHVKCGSLLKDWNMIPGREVTPPRETRANSEIVEFHTVSVAEDTIAPKENKTQLPIISKRRSISPDLFESDDDDDCDRNTYLLENHRVEVEYKFIQDSQQKQSVQLDDNKLKVNRGTSFDSGFVSEKVKNSLNDRTVEIKMSINEEMAIEKSRDNFSKKICTDDSPELSLLSLRSSSSQEKKNEKNINLNFLSNEKDELIRASNGILYFESFCKESEVLSQGIIDLTQSSDEENREKIMENFDDDDDQETNLPNSLENECLMFTEPDFNVNDDVSRSSDPEIIVENQVWTSPQPQQNNSFQTMSLEETFCRDSLNVTDYIQKILNDNNSDLCASDDEIVNLTQSNTQTKKQESENTVPALVKHSSFASNGSHESICISDEELNYSSLHAKGNEIDDEQHEQTSPEIARKNPQLQEVDERATTPKPTFVVRTTNVTPAPDFDGMDTPKVTKELKKYGVKAMKRKRGVQLLKYIYDAMHPLVGEHNGVFEENVAKKRKFDEAQIPADSSSSSHIEIVGDAIIQNESPEDLIFEKSESKRIHSCRLPLQIAFHNMVSCNPEIRKKILLYEPLHLQELYLLLKNQGFKYDIKDLLTFLDRKCITVRTNQN